jgi:hypothetical protein
MVNPCPDGQVLDKLTKECRPPLKRGRKSGRFSATAKATAMAATVKAKTKATVKTRAKKPCPDGQVLDKVTKECRPPLKRGRTSKKSPNKSPNKSPAKPPAELHDNTTLDKYGFAVPVFRPKIYNDAKTYRQTTISFGKRKS